MAKLILFSLLWLVAITAVAVDVGTRPARAQDGCWFWGFEFVNGVPVEGWVTAPSRLRLCETDGDPPPEPTDVPTATGIPTATNTAVPSATNTPTQAPVSTPVPIPTSTGVSVVVPDDYATIPAALAGVAPGTTIRIRGGLYPGGNVVTKPGITLTRFDESPVWIDGNCATMFGIHFEGPATGGAVVGLGIRNLQWNGIAVWPRDLAGKPSNMLFTQNVIQNYNCTNNSSDGEYLAGINFYYAGSGQTVTNNMISHTPRMGKGNSIFMKGDTNNPTGGGHVFTGNTLIGGYDGIGSQVEDDHRGGFDGNTLIANNTIRDCWDDGIQVEGGNAHVVVRDNVITECQIGIAIAPTFIGPLHIERNYIKSTSYGWAGNLSCFKVGNYQTDAAFVYFTDNYCDVRATNGGMVLNPQGINVGDGIEQTNAGNSSYVMRGNTLLTGRYSLEFSSTPTSSTSMDQDCLYNVDPTRFVKWGQVRYYNIQELRAGTGQEFNGIGVIAPAPNPCIVSNEFGGAPPPPAYGPPPPSPTPTVTQVPTITPTATITPTPIPGVVVDTFTGVSGLNLNAHTMNTGLGWSYSVGDWVIQNNKAQPPGNTNHAIVQTDALQGDGTLSVSIDVPNANNYSLGLYVRDTYNVVVQRNGGGAPYLAIYEQGVAHAQQDLATSPTGTTITMTVVLAGSNVSATVGSTTVTFDGAVPATWIGMYAYTGDGYAVGTFDNFVLR